MSNESKPKLFPGFEILPESIYKFARAGTLFTLLLKNGQIIHYETVDNELFRNWLLDHNVKDIKF